METILLFIAAAIVTCLTYLWRNQITEKPWLTAGAIEDDASGVSDEIDPAARTGLMVFLAVVTSVFALFISAYFLRMELNDWRPLPEPGLLWVNTLLLFIGSFGMQAAWNAARREDKRGIQNGLLIAGAFTLAFIGGQLWAWQLLSDSGYFVYSNPANAFFFVFTGLHAIHLLGGLWVWLTTTHRLWSGAHLETVGLRVELCKTYWHYLLIVWLVLFALLLST